MIFGQLSSQIRASPNQTKSAMESALPVLMNALAQNSKTPQGASALESVLSSKHDRSILDNLSSFLGNPDLKDGAGILKHVLGDKRQNVEQYVSSGSGLNSQSSGKMLEMLDPIVLGYFGKQQKSSQSGGIGDVLGSLLNQGKDSSAHSQSLIENLLDQNNDGSIVDDVAKMGSSLLGKLFK